MGLFLFFFFWYDINTVKDREFTKPPAKTANNNTKPDAYGKMDVHTSYFISWS